LNRPFRYSDGAKHRTTGANIHDECRLSHSQNATLDAVTEVRRGDDGLQQDTNRLQRKVQSQDTAPAGNKYVTPAVGSLITKTNSIYSWKVNDQRKAGRDA